MSDQNTPADQPVPAPEAPENADTPEVASEEKGPSRWQRLRSRAGTVGKGAVVALVAGLVLGSAGGFAAGAVLAGDDHGDDRRGHDGQHGRPFGDEMGHGFGPPPGGQLPPTTAPEDPDDGTTDPSGAELNG